MNYLERDFHKFWSQIRTEIMAYRTAIFEQKYHWLFVELFICLQN